MRDLIIAGGELTLGERFELWESREDKNVLEDFPIGELSEEQYHEVLDKLGIAKRVVIVENEFVLITGLYKGEDFPYIVVEKNVDGDYILFQVDGKNDWGDGQYRVVNRYSILGI